jgi:phospholipid/cholesterol/gamma-HCH transport system substrate-binding protein
MGVIVVLLVIAVGGTFTNAPQIFATPEYFGQFADTGGLSVGDKVRIAGVDVGLVKSMDIDRDQVKIGFTLGSTTIGSESRAMIRTDTVLGRKNIEIEPKGSKTLPPRGVLPLGQTSTPYQIYDAFLDVTRNAQGWDTKSVKQALDVLSDTARETSPHLSAALDGVARFSETIGKRDEQVKQLLANANKIATILGDRSTQINTLLVNAQTLLAAANERSQAIGALLGRITEVSAQVTGFIDENPNLNHVLEQLKTVSDILVKRKNDLAETLVVAGKFIISLAESLASGPYFKSMVVNLLPYQIIQPFVDAAFKKRGIDPEQFWRSAGLPEFRFPDPNGQRFENGAPPPAPTVLEGTPEFPGPAVIAGSPCSYTAGPDALPTPADPLPCAHTSVGPFGDNPYGANYPQGLPGVVNAPPNPNAVISNGVPAAAVPGELPPDVAGVPPPAAVPGPIGARTVPLGPLPGPQDLTPAIAPLPPALTGPPPPPGPGPDAGPAGQPPLPGNPPFLPPGSQG